MGAAVLVAALSLVGCLSGEAGPEACGSCLEGQVCVELPGCTGPDCWECRQECDPAIPATSACRTGQACVPLEDDPVSAGYCGLCQAELCPEGQECVGDACHPVECSLRVACQKETDLCDTFANACYPSNGACESADGCPRFNDRISAAGELVCREGFCRLDPLPPPRVPGLGAAAEVEWVSPQRGTRLSSADELRLIWSGPQADALVLILSGVPQTRDDMLRLALWGASVPAGQPAELRIGDGVEIIDGTWSGNHAAWLPPDTPLYALVQLVEGDRLAAISPLMLFMIGQGWKEPGSRCEPSDTLPDRCENPLRVQACIANRCRVLCASNRDCLPWSQTCGWPEDGLRYCR